MMAVEPAHCRANTSGRHGRQNTIIMGDPRTIRHDDVEMDPGDVFFVVAVTSQDRLAGFDPGAELARRTLEYSETLRRMGLRPPRIKQYPYEIHFLSYSYADQFPRFGAQSATYPAETYCSALYFFSREARALAMRHSIPLNIVKTITRAELPEPHGSVAPFGSRTWDDDFDVEAYSFEPKGPRVEL